MLKLFKLKTDWCYQRVEFFFFGGGGGGSLGKWLNCESCIAGKEETGFELKAKQSKVQVKA